jgi:uncharacterized protein
MCAPAPRETLEAWKGDAMATQTVKDRPATLRPVEGVFRGRYLSLTSFKRDGTAVATPLWFVSDATRLYALTDLHSGKIARIRRDPHVLIASCRPDGKLRGEPVPARAEVLTDTADLERVRELLIARYKLSYRLVMLIYSLGRRLRGRSSIAEGAALAISLE